MIKKFVEEWNLNKSELEEYISTHKLNEYADTYKDLVKTLFTYVINLEETNDYNRYDTNDIKVIDDGDYQGTQIFILHKDTYQPGVDEYVYTSNYYGSCSGCDTLLRITNYDLDEIPSKEQVKDLMTIFLHLLQNCVEMKEGEIKQGW